MVVCATFGSHEFHELSRVSKNGRQTDACQRKIFLNLRKILAFERETVKISSFNMIFTDFDTLFLCFMAFPAHFYAQLFYRTFCLLNENCFLENLTAYMPNHAFLKLLLNC